jgi:hypothetical protein
MESNENGENIEQRYSEISDHKDDGDKLNINTKKAESSRDEMIPKEEKTDDKNNKENNEDNAEEKKEEQNKEQNEEQNEEKKSEDELKTIQKRIKLPIIPYKISESYPQNLLNVLQKENRTRPKHLLAPEMGDITRNITDLEKDELKQLKLEEAEHQNLENKERDDKIHLGRYKDSSFQGETFIQDPFALFYGAEAAYIDQFYKLSDLFVICPLYFNYRISLEYTIQEEEGAKKLAAYHLFNTKETSPPCSHNCCANQAREIDINIFNLTLQPEDKTRRLQKFVTLKKACRCAFSCFCACCSRPTFYVDTPIDNLGRIVELRTTCDPILNIIDINDEVSYVISASGSSCGFCCRDQCCGARKCASCEFYIYDAEMKNKIGFITKDHKSGKKMMPDYDQLKVTFPPSISCQDKILLVCATIILEYLYFQNLSNSKRCSGAPRFLNAYSD